MKCLVEYLRPLAHALAESGNECLCDYFCQNEPKRAFLFDVPSFKLGQYKVRVETMASLTSEYLGKQERARLPSLHVVQFLEVY